jgi:hypothetical protein
MRLFRSQLRFGMSLVGMANSSGRRPDERRVYAAKAEKVHTTIVGLLAKKLLAPDDELDVRRGLGSLALAIGSIQR